MNMILACQHYITICFKTQELSDYVSPIKTVLSSTGVAPESVAKVVVCGGNTKIPKVQKAVSALFSKGEASGITSECWTGYYCRH